MKAFNKKYGILGGTFNPIHNGHIELAKHALSEYSLEKVLIMPSHVPPHKSGQVITSGKKRSDMVKLAIQGCAGLEYSGVELEREGITYTSDTLTYLNASQESTYFIIGADSLINIERWHCPEIIMNLCTLIVANRDRHNNDELKAFISRLTAKYNARIDILHISDIPISSSQIRYNITNNISVDGMIDSKVYDYIRQNNLYV